MQIKYLFVILLLLSVIPTLLSQSEIKNPSFEETTRMGKVPNHWNSCKRGGTPDILPGVWEVNTVAAEGKTYVGLITRSEGTWESIGQKLSKPVIPDECHSFTVQLARSPTYVDYNLPIKLRVYLGDGLCDKAQLIGESTNITTEDWHKTEFSFVPEAPYTFLILEAYYGNGIYIYYNGNILIDDLSSIKMCPRA